MSKHKATQQRAVISPSGKIVLVRTALSVARIANQLRPYDEFVMKRKPRPGG